MTDGSKGRGHMADGSRQMTDGSKGRGHMTDGSKTVNQRADDWNYFLVKRAHHFSGSLIIFPSILPTSLYF